MAGPRTRRNAGGAPTNNSGTPVPIPAVSRTPTPASAQTPVLTEAPAPAQTLAAAPAPAFVPGPPGRYMDENLQKATKLALKLFVKGQEYGQLQASSAPYEQPLKAWFPDLYYRNSHLDCYCFCQQCKDHFKTAGANEPNRVPFATSFLRGAMI